MKKILQVTTVSLSLGFISDHVNKLVKDYNKVDIATNIVEPIKPNLIDETVNVFPIEFQRNPISLKNVLAYKNIRNLCKRNKYDIVHVHTPVAAFITRLALRREKTIKVIYTAHGFHFYKGSNILNWTLYYTLEKIAAKWTDIIITINEEDYLNAKKFKLKNQGKVYKVNGVGIKQLDISENLNINRERNLLGLNNNDFIILILAEINKNKNHIQLIRAMSLLKDKYPNIKAVFAGTGPEEEYIKQYIKKYNLEDKVKLLGWRNDALNLINISDVLALLSKREGLPKCIMEAMMYNTCIISTNIRGPKDLIENEVSGFLVNVNDYKETAKKIEKLYLNKNLRKEFEQKSRIKINDFLIENVLDQLDNIYLELNSNK